VRRGVLIAVAAPAFALAAPAAAAPPVSYQTALAPREVLFGDPVEARADVVVDPGRVDPRAVRVHVDFRPYRVASAAVTRRAAGDLVRVRFAYRLDCLAKACLPKGPERTVSFRPLRITSGNQTQTTFWPNLRLASRIDPRDLSRPTLRSEALRQPPVTWGVRPRVATGLLVAAALLLLAYPALLAVRALRRRLRVWRTTRLERLTPLERALELLRRAAAGDEADRGRLALERVARELGDDELGSDARRLAWSRPQPDSQSMDSLRTRVEDAG
jgi:hypothetical protein